MDSSRAVTETTLRAWLSLANRQFSARLLGALLDHFQHAPPAILEATDAELETVSGFQARHAVRLRDVRLDADDRQVEWYTRHAIRLLLHSDSDYPAWLQQIPEPPVLLFVWGTLPPPDALGIGIVGSRHATPYGRQVAERFAKELAESGLVIVSGGAVGIDACAHKGALQAGGKTVAVLGCGLDVDYPRENRPLFAQIVQSGALISEYPLGSQPEAWHFPMRNRIISGMAQGVLVVEAPKQSGALITARYATEQHGRPVMAIPGNIDRPASAGTNDLLKEGAVMVTEVADILHTLGLVRLSTRAPQQPALDFSPKPAEVEGVPPTPAIFAPLMQNLSPFRRQILECLSQTPRHPDSIAQTLQCPIADITTEMVLLEMEGFVQRLPGNTYILVS